MTINSFARFVLETPVPKGHLDITSLLFAPLEVSFSYFENKQKLVAFCICVSITFGGSKRKENLPGTTALVVFDSKIGFLCLLHVLKIPF